MYFCTKQQDTNYRASKHRSCNKERYKISQNAITASTAQKGSSAGCLESRDTLSNRDPRILLAALSKFGSWEIEPHGSKCRCEQLSALWRTSDLEPGRALLTKIWMHGNSYSRENKGFLKWTHNREVIPCVNNHPNKLHNSSIIWYGPSGWFHCHSYISTVLLHPKMRLKIKFLSSV